MLAMEKLVSDLRAYAAREHGKRAALHFEISSQVFAFAAELADEIERLQSIEQQYEYLMSAALDRPIQPQQRPLR
jgi:hypothetical protein